MTCLETSFLIDLFRGKEKVNKLMDELNKHEEQLTVAAPTIMELWSGALLAIHSEREKAKINELLQFTDVLTLDEKSAKIAAEIEYDLEQKGQIIQLEDIQIAAIAKAHGEQFARIPGLRVLKY